MGTANRKSTIDKKRTKKKKQSKHNTKVSHQITREENKRGRGERRPTKTRPVYMLSTRDPIEIQGHIQTESEGMEKGIPCKWKSKESWSGNTHIRQSRL